MSANADVLGRAETVRVSVARTAWPLPQIISESGQWNPQDFAREQIRGLVRQVFLTGGAPPPRQVAFSAADAEIDVYGVCDQVGSALALETGADVAVVSDEQPFADMLRPHPRFGGRVTIKSWSKSKGSNLWEVPRRGGRDYGTGRYWLSFLAELRNEFEYAIIHAPIVGTSSEAVLLGRLADGIVLVLGAHTTRKAIARTIKERLVGAQCHILGTVLSERRFPIPDWIYRRL